MSVIVADTFRTRVAGAAVTTTKGLNVGGATTVAGAVVATSFAGDGSSITALSGSNISSGTVAAARLPSDLNTTGTAGGLTGTPDITIRNVTGVAATFTGVLTYEDVTNVDSVGFITARSGIKFGAAGIGGTIAANGNTTLAGVVTATTFVGNLTGDPTGTVQTAAQPNITSVGTLTNLVATASSVTGISSVGLAITMYGSSGIVSATTFYGDGSQLEGVSSPTVIDITSCLFI